jgi:hypothetical protein
MESERPKAESAVLYDGQWHAVDRRNARRTRCQMFIPQDDWDQLPREDRQPDCPACLRAWTR